MMCDACDMCGGETVLDRQQGHVVCTECGGVCEEWVVADDRYEASCRTSADQADHVGRVNRPAVLKTKIASFVDACGLGSSVSTMASHMVDAVPARAVRDREIDAWALISIACERLRSGRSVMDMARASGVPTKQLISVREAIRPYVRQFFDDAPDAPDPVDETVTAMNPIMAALWQPHETASKLAARKWAVRHMQTAVCGNASFMNMRPSTRARVILAKYFVVHSLEDRRNVLKLGSSGTRSGLKKLSAPRSSESR